MPYGGTTPAQDTKIEACVVKLMADASFKPKAGETKKVAAIRVCKSSVMKAEPEGYDFTLEITKATATTTESGKLIIEGIASSPGVDRQDEAMTPAAIQSMLKQIKSGKVPLHNEHGRSWHDRIGDVIDGSIDGAGNLTIKAELNKEHPLTKLLYDSIKKGETFGLSIAGQVRGFTQQMRTDLGKMVRVFDNINLREISVTKHPANLSAIGLVAKSHGWLYEIAKSVPEEEWINQEKKGDTMADPTDETTTTTDETDTPVTESTETVEESATPEVAPEPEAAEETEVPVVAEKSMRKLPVAKRRSILQEAEKAHQVHMQALKAAIGHDDADEDDGAKPGMVGAGQTQRDVKTKKSDDAFSDVELVAKALRRLISDDQPTGIDKVTKAMSDVIEESNAKRDQVIEALVEKAKVQDSLIEELRGLPLRRKGVAVAKGTGDEVVIARKSDPEPGTEEAADFRSAYKSNRVQ